MRRRKWYCVIKAVCTDRPTGKVAKLQCFSDATKDSVPVLFILVYNGSIGLNV